MMHSNSCGCEQCRIEQEESVEVDEFIRPALQANRRIDDGSPLPVATGGGVLSRKAS
jgi:hypothetical protein